jgi:hypothetical protein
MGFVWFEVWLGSSRLLLLLRSRQEITYTVWLDLFADGCVARFLQPATRLLGARALPSTKICCAISCKPYFLTAPYWQHNEKPPVLAAVIHADRWTPPALVAGIAEIYRSRIKPPQKPEPSTIENPPETFENRPVKIFSGERDAPTQVARVLRLIQSGKMKVTDSTKRPTEASVRALSGLLIQPDFELEFPEGGEKPWPHLKPNPAGAVRAHAWGVLVQQCGWARARAGALMLTEDWQGPFLLNPCSSCQSVASSTAGF